MGGLFSDAQRTFGLFPAVPWTLTYSTLAVFSSSTYELVKNLHGFNLCPPSTYRWQRLGALFRLHQAIDTIDDGDEKP